MFTKVKDYFKFLISHWVMTLVFLMVVVAFAVPVLGGLYDKVAGKLSFLPARKV